MDGFNGILDIGNDERKINKWKRIVSRSVGIFKKLNSKVKESKKIRQILLHWCYELTLS